ncbi:MAG TPA: hypothetical protein VH137_09580 [Gemmatimonadales bacterium]|jgi:hypothetical protein|nr:hypothetical protein [Gemmatimonadales bacterium]
MANVNLTQLRTILHSVPALQPVRISAGTLRALLDAAKTANGGSEVAFMQNAGPAPAHLTEIDLTQI